MGACRGIMGDRRRSSWTWLQQWVGGDNSWHTTYPPLVSRARRHTPSTRDGDDRQCTTWPVLRRHAQDALCVCERIFMGRLLWAPRGGHEARRRVHAMTGGRGGGFGEGSVRERREVEGRGSLPWLGRRAGQVGEVLAAGLLLCCGIDFFITAHLLRSTDNLSANNPPTHTLAH